MNNVVFKDLITRYGVRAGEIYFAAFNDRPLSFRSEEDNLISAIFNMKPEEAIRYLESKGFAITFDWQALSAEAQQQAFTVAKVTRLDLLQDIKDALIKAQSEGSTVEQFKKDLKPIIESKGWSGRKEITLKDGTKSTVNLTPSRLETVYRTNLQSAYSAGRWQQIEEAKQTRPYLQFLAVVDESTSDVCSSLNRKVFAVDDEIWNSIMPPLHHNCRSTVRSLSEKQLVREGLTPENIDPKTLDIQDNFRANPGKTKYEPDLTKYDSEFLG